MKLYSVVAVILVAACACASGPAGTPTPAVVDDSSIGYWADDFSDPTSRWEADYKSDGKGYLDGVYAIVANGELVRGTAHKHSKFDSVAIDVDTTRAAGSGSYGVACRVQRDRGYYFLLNPENRSYAIAKRTSDGYSLLVNWRVSQVVRLSENHIRAVCGGAQLALFVNDQHLAVAEDHSFVSGNIALVASGTNLEAHFDNVFVQYIPSEKLQKKGEQ